MTNNQIIEAKGDFLTNPQSLNSGIGGKAWWIVDYLEHSTMTGTGCNQKSKWKNMTQSSISSEVVIGFWLEKTMIKELNKEWRNQTGW